MINERKNVQSRFVIYISAKENSIINKYFIEPKINKFFSNKNIKYESITENKEISDLDFKTVNFYDFYDMIFYNINKNKDGKIEVPAKYCITFDEQNCQKTCDETNIKYDVMLLYNKPVFYFIYIGIDEIFSFLRNYKS